MDMYATLAFATIGLVAVVVVWFGRLPRMRHARRASNGYPNALWWTTFWTAVLLTALVANQLPDIL